ncbi:uncharacterized protein LOC143916758 [Arctopsyche grandis]|uniref:uncharacterized protein LOC143916758 n=1 Tax=Arctopsyche grandis TaxID=121162 RepID=UPI00406D83DC
MIPTNPHNYNNDFPKLIRESGFIFDAWKTNTRIDWNEIRAIDVERLVLERDFRTIDDHTYEVLNCQLDTEFDLRILDSGFVKLFRLAQLSVEYLLQCRRQLDVIISSSKEDMKQLREEKEYLKKQLNSKEDEIRKLQNKVRKRHKSAGQHKYDEISEFLKNLVLNGSSNTTLSVGEQNLAALYKCTHCEKLFLNQFFLQSHVTRRHLNGNSRLDKNNVLTGENVGELVQSSGFHQESEYKIMTENLHQEIKDMRERLSIAEKRHFDEFFNPINKVENNEIQKEETESNEKSQIIVVGSTENKSSISETIVNNNVTKEMFEEWRKEEQNKYMSEIEILKAQLLDSMNKMTEDIKDSTVKNENIDDNTEKLLNITTALRKQEEEVRFLKEQLDKKAVSTESELTSQLEGQEKIWKVKLQSLEEQYTSTIEELKRNITINTSESEAIQQQYKIKIDDLEKNLKSQRQALDIQSHKLDTINETNKTLSEMVEQYQHFSKNMHYRGEKRQNLLLVESQETLPPYEDNIHTSNEDVRSLNLVVNSAAEKLVRSSSSLNNRTKEIVNHFSSDTSVDTEFAAVKKDDINSKTRHQANLKKSVSAKQLFTEAKQENIRKSPLRNKNQTLKKSQSIDQVKDNKNFASNIEKEIKNKHITSTSDSESISGNITKKIRMKPTKKQRTTNLSPSTANSWEKVLAQKPNLTKAVKKDLQLLVKKRLQHIGVKSKEKGISSEDFKKAVKFMQHKQQLMSKQYRGYSKNRKTIMKNLDEKLKQLDMSERTSTSSAVELSKPNSPFRVMGSIFSNVKNKALNIVRSRENLKSDLDSTLPMKTRLTQNSRLNEFQKSTEAITSTPNKLSAKSILAMLDSQDKNPNIMQDTIETKDEKSETSTGSSDASSSDEESEYSDPNKPTSEVIVTTAIAHTPSKSIENLLKSPIRKPTTNLIKNQSPIKTVEVSKATIVESNVQLHSTGRFSKSETNISSTILDDSMSLSETDTGDDTLDNIKSFPPRKAMSEDNVSTKTTLISPKGVLKSVASAGSLTKKKVLFDLDANEVKPPSSTNSTYTITQPSTQEDSTKIVSNDWNISDDDFQDDATNVDDVINLSTKQSPKIAEISKLIQSQLGSRSEIKPPLGSVEAMFQASTVQNSHKNLKELDFTVTTNKLPVPAPRATHKNRIESDIELSDWSLDELINAK